MLRASLLFAVLAAISGLLGFTGLRADFSFAGRVLFFVFASLLVISLVLRGRSIKSVI